MRHTLLILAVGITLALILSSPSDVARGTSTQFRVFGDVAGQVLPHKSTDGLQSRPLPFLDVHVNDPDPIGDDPYPGSPFNSGSNSHYDSGQQDRANMDPFGGEGEVLVHAGLEGRFVKVLDMGWAGLGGEPKHDENLGQISGDTEHPVTFSGEPETNIYYQVNRARSFFAGSPFNFTGLDAYQIRAEYDVDIDFAGCGSIWCDPFVWNAQANGSRNPPTLQFGITDDWAESADIILHEYVHLVIHTIYGDIGSPGSLGGSYEAKAMNEGLADYWAAAVNGDNDGCIGCGEGLPVARDLVQSTDDRRYDDPDEFGPTVPFHEASRVISGALWDMRSDIGATKADRLIFEALRQKKVTFEGLLCSILELNNSLYGGADDTKIRNAFSGHAIQPTSCPSGPSGNVDVALIIDSSGSMSWNDPANKRLDAAKAYLTASLEGDFVGVVDFDSGVRVASPLQRLPDNKTSLTNAINTINSSGGTNVGIGVQAGCNVLIASTSGNATKAAVLLTDGQGSFSGQDNCFKDRGWPIYTFGFGSANDALLQQIASNTGGEFARLPTTELVCEFQRVRTKIAGGTPGPCTATHVDPDTTTSLLASILPGQAQATFSTSWIGSDVVMSLVEPGPDGRLITRENWNSYPDVTHDLGPTFEVYGITNPEPGDWEVNLFGADVPAGGEDVIFTATTVPLVGDSVAPSTGISLDPTSPDGNNGWYVSPVTVTLTAVDDPGGSGVASTEYRLDGGTWQTYAGPFTLSTDGTTSVDARSTDNAANVEDPPASATVQIDQTAPGVNIEVPTEGVAVQDGVTLAASANDATSGVADVRLYVREDDGGSGIGVGFEDLAATYNSGTGHWEYSFDSTALPDGYYVALAKAEDNAGNEAWSSVRHFSIRNWAVLELLPASESNKAGRTMPVKFSLRIAAAVDPAQPFVYNEDLTIKIYETGHSGDVLQTSMYGSGARDYRIDQVGEKYITNFKTLKRPKDYTVDIWRHNTIDFLVGSFDFRTVK